MNIRKVSFLAAGLSAALALSCSAQDMGGGMGGTSSSNGTSGDSAAKMDMTPAAPDAQMQAVLDAYAALNPKPLETLTANEARQQPSIGDAAMAVMKNKGLSTDPEPVGGVDNRTVPGTAGDIPVRVYYPQGNGPFPVLVYYHGGGWVIGTLDTYDASCRALCNLVSCVVVSVDYRKAPENKFPASVDDAYSTYEWVTKNAATIKGDASKIAVGGESAGGNLAAVVSIEAKEKNAPIPVAQLLIYPVTDYSFDTMSYTTYAAAKPLNKPAMIWFWDKYLSDPASGKDPHASPLQSSDLTGLPPATVITDQIDPLHDEGAAYAKKLKDAGVKTMYRNFDGVTHEFFGLGKVVDKSKEAELFAADSLLQCFSK